MSNIALSIIIVNWNSKDYLQRCIASIKRNAPIDNFEILVIDSGSFDNCGKMLTECFPDVHFIQSNHNMGFGRANNAAFKCSRGEVILFLNPDTEIINGAISILLDHMRILERPGLIGAKLLNSDGSIQTSCVQSFPTIVNQVFNFNFLRQRFPLWKMWGRSAVIQNAEPAAVDCVSGACLMIQRPLFADLGMFSDEFFMYSEDIDLCYKVRQAGYQVYYIPHAVVVHHGGTSSAQNNAGRFSSVMQVESQHKFFYKNRSAAYSRKYRLAMGAACTVRVASLLTILPLFSLCGRAQAVEIALKKWVARLRWALGLESWVRKF